MVFSVNIFRGIGRFKINRLYIPIRCATNTPSYFIFNEALYLPKPGKSFKKTEEKDGVWAGTPNDRYTQVEEVEGHWHFVERLLPSRPPSTQQLGDEALPSGWAPPTANPKGIAKGLTYFVRRTKNNMLPVYYYVEPRGPRQITQIRNVQGELLNLANDLKNFLEQKQSREVTFMVHECAGYIKLKGNHKEDVCDWLLHLGY